MNFRFKPNFLVGMCPPAILMLIADYTVKGEKLTQSDISKALSLNGSTIIRNINILSKHGLINFEMNVHKNRKFISSSQKGEVVADMLRRVCLLVGCQRMPEHDKPQRGRGGMNE